MRLHERYRSALSLRATYTSASLLPIANRHCLGLLWGPRFDYRWKEATGLLGGGYAKQKTGRITSCFFCFIERTYGTVSKFKSFCSAESASSKQQQRCSPITNHQSPITYSLCRHHVPSSKLSACAHQSPHRVPKINVCFILGERRYELLLSGYPKVNQDSVCLLLGERRYMSPNDAGHQSLRPCYRTREQSDIIRAISLPNAARPLNSSNAASQLPITNYQLPIGYPK